MAAPVHSSERGRMGAREHEERRDIDAAGEVKNPPRPPPYMRRSVIQAAAHKSPPERPPISGARKVKTPSKSASTFCSSAPAATKRSPAGGAATLNSPLKAQREASSVRIGAVREQRGVPLIQKEPQMKCWTAYVRLPARLKRSGLKLWDPEKVKTLMSASRLPVSGDVKQKIVHHQTNFNRESSRQIHRQNTLPQAAVKQTESSRKRTGIISRREINQSDQPKSLLADEAIGSHQLSQQMNQLLLDDKGCDESRTSAGGRLYNSPQQTAQIKDCPHAAKNSDQTVQDDACHLKPNAQDNQKSSHLTNVFKKSGQIEATGSSVLKDIGTLVPTCSYLQPGAVQEQLPRNKESLSQPSSCHGAEDHIQDPSSDNTQPSCPDVNVVDGLYKTSSETEPTTKAHGQDNCQSSPNPLKDFGTYDAKSQPASGEKNSLTESNSAEDDFLSKKGDTIFKPNLPSDEQNTTEEGNQEEPHQHVWSRTNDVIRQSQGVLVLTRSTDEDAVFIPKLKFEVTPDNSIDWTMIGPTALDSTKRCPTKKNDPSILNVFTPRGPSISKSLLKKSFMLSGHDLLPGSSSKSAQRFSSAEDVTRSSHHPLARIVDLSISFQGKFEKQEIPANIPKILLSEDDNDND